MAVGRISGPLLKDNLLRNGVNLAFETSLLYLDVNNSRVGVRTASPAYDLDVNGTTRTTNLETTTQADLATFTISGNTISSTSSTINFVPSGANAVVYQGRALLGTQLEISGNTLKTLGVDQDLNITTAGIGKVNVNGDVMVYGSVHATGSITADGNITLGNDTGDNIVFGGEVNSDIVPDADNTYNLGTATPSPGYPNGKRWGTVYTENATIATVNATNLTVDDFKTTQLEISGNTISTQTANTNINFSTSGTGGVVIGSLKIGNNSIQNITSGGVTTFNETGTGYVKFTGTNGIVLPVGSVNARPIALNSEQGMIRYNNELNLVEMWTGTSWFSVAGSSAGVTADVATDIGIATTIIFG